MQFWTYSVRTELVHLSNLRPINLNFESLIARRLALSRGKSFTKTIVGIAIAAIAISLSVMLLANAMITGFKKEIHSKIFGFWGHIHITDTNYNRDFELRPISIADRYYSELEKVKNIEYQKPVEFLGFDLKDKYRTVKTQGGIEHIQPFIIMPGLIESSDEFQAILFKGVDEAFDWTKMQRFITHGQGLTPGKEDEIVVSKIIANKLSLKVGQEVVVSFVKSKSKIRRKLRVAGIFNTGLEEYDKRFVIGNMTKLRELLGWNEDQVAGIEVFLDDIQDSEVIAEYVYNYILPDNLYAERIQQKFPSIFEWLKLQDINEKVILQLMAIVAIINMVTVLLILILERTNMIGIVKALGARNWQIQKIFLYYAGIIIIAGQFLGNLLGLGLAWLQKTYKFLKLDEQNYYLDTAPIHIDWSTVIWINFGAFLVILTFLVLPTFIINKIRPIQALRFK